MRARRGKAIATALLLASILWLGCNFIFKSAGYNLSLFARQDLVHSEPANGLDATKQFDMTAASMIDKDIQALGHYSGMWWMRMDCFMSHVHPERFHSLEDASLVPFQAMGEDHIFMTYDWLDLAVEHLSRFIRQLDIGRDEVMDQLMAKLTRYIHQSPRMWPQDAPFSQTLAVIPIFVDETAWSDPFLSSLPKSTSDASWKTRENVLDMISLAATLVSLCRVGMRRIVVVGNVPDEPTLIQGAFRLARSVGCDNDSLAYRCPFKEAQAQVDNMPKVVLQALKAQYNRSGDAEAALFGVNRNQFRYLYFSEPDLILHTRAKALVRMVDRLDEPICRIWSAHRPQPLPHEIDFPTLPHVIPAVGNSSWFQDLTVDSSDTCNDAGNYWPGRTIENCGAPWYACGLDRPDQPPMERFQRLAAYPMLTAGGSWHSPGR